MKNHLRLALVAAVTGVALATAGTAHAAAQIFPPPPPRLCELTIVSVTADNLEADGATDSVFLSLGTTTTVNSVDFAVGQTQPGSAFGDPSAFYVAPATLALKLFVKQGASRLQIGGTATAPCVATTASTRTFTNNDATYRLVFRVDLEVLVP